MVINDFNSFGPCMSPGKTDSPLIINSYAMLPSPITFESFQAVTRGHSQVIE